jgi:hypothetical protein
MKKSIFIISIVLFLGVCVLGQAQESTTDSKIFAKTILVYKVYTHSMGFKVVYHKAGLKLGVLYLPYKWFELKDRIAEAVYGSDRSYPYFTVFYKDGKIDRIRLFLHESPDHLSWGMLHITSEEADKLFNVDKTNVSVEY